jgi:hypothetical protein
MTDLENMLAQPMLEALGWGLIHFIWQGVLVALSLACVLRMLRGSSTNARYAAACVTLLLMPRMIWPRRCAVTRSHMYGPCSKWNSFAPPGRNWLWRRGLLYPAGLDHR